MGGIGAEVKGGLLAANEALVFAVRADPEPHEAILVRIGESAVVQSYARGPKLRSQLLELQRGVPRIGFQKPVALESRSLHRFRQYVKEGPEFRIGPMPP